MHFQVLVFIISKDAQIQDKLLIFIEVKVTDIHEKLIIIKYIEKKN